ncbi:hypothetical protein TWF506_004359 [Arthrobotrys conoides]|uniref:Uncharacterized protein n=1 Tax=Arthrobotrys conoides TaxID=74498 RepID=A0AAN8NJW9_9PEZI
MIRHESWPCYFGSGPAVEKLPPGQNSNLLNVWDRYLPSIWDISQMRRDNVSQTSWVPSTCVFNKLPNVVLATLPLRHFPHLRIWCLPGIWDIPRRLGIDISPMVRDWLFSHVAENTMDLRFAPDYHPILYIPADFVVLVPISAKGHSTSAETSTAPWQMRKSRKPYSALLSIPLVIELIYRYIMRCFTRRHEISPGRYGIFPIRCGIDIS